MLVHGLKKHDRFELNHVSSAILSLDPALVWIDLHRKRSWASALGMKARDTSQLVEMIQEVGEKKLTPLPGKKARVKKTLVAERSCSRTC
jgi:hypothetical protein